jgi:hypothetical protein
VAYRTTAQRERERRVEAVIRVVAPVLDVILYAGDKASRVAGRNQLPPEPIRRPGLPPARRD